MPENTTRIVGTFKCPDGHTFETVQNPIMSCPCLEPECGATARRQATHFEPSPLVSEALVRLALTRAADWMKGGGPADQQFSIIKELHGLLGQVAEITEGVALEPKPEASASPTPADKLARLRVDGWMVVCHNDYRLDGKRMTFWSFANGPHYIKGEGPTDDIALTACERAAVFVKRTHG